MHELVMKDIFCQKDDITNGRMTVVQSQAVWGISGVNGLKRRDRDPLFFCRS